MPGTAQKYLIFSIGSEWYGIPIAKVQEVIRYEAISPIHNASRFFKGVINLRGRIIPIVDMRLKFGLEERVYDDRSVFVIVEVSADSSHYLFGMAVDAVHEVCSIDDEDREALPDVGFQTQDQYLLGIARVRQSMVMLLNIDQVLSHSEVVTIEAATT